MEKNTEEGEAFNVHSAIQPCILKSSMLHLLRIPYPAHSYFLGCKWAKKAVGSNFFAMPDATHFVNRL